MEDREDHPVFKDLWKQISALRQDVDFSVGAGHQNLGPDLWLSTDPAGRAEMACRSVEDGFALRLAAGDSGQWTCLGMRLPIEVLRRGHYLGLLVAARSEGAFSFTPTLRYFLADGMHDTPAALPVVLTGAAREHLAHIPIDGDRLGQAKTCELNLFFHTDAFAAEFTALRPLLMS